MPRFEPKTFPYFKRRISQRIVARTPLTDLETGGVVDTIAGAVARECDDLSYQQVQVRRIWSFDKAQGRDLDDRAADMTIGGLTPVRSQGNRALGEVVFSRTGTSGQIGPIAAGRLVRVPDSGVSFRTTEAITILNGDQDSNTVSITAVDVGEDGNVDTDTIIEMDPIEGIETVTNAAATTGGLDRESDSAFRERLKLWVRSLPHGIPDALKFAALSVATEDGEIRFAQVIEGVGADLGSVIVYVDNGLGTISQILPSGAETVIASALGGEKRFFLDHNAIVENSVALTINATPVDSADYFVNYGTGQITLDPTAYPDGLLIADVVAANYTYYSGLISEAQKVIDGDPDDRENYRGYRAAGAYVQVLPPTVISLAIEGSVVVETGFDQDTVLAQATAAIVNYVNSLGIAEDVVWSELVHAVQAIEGVYDVTFSTPSDSVQVDDGEIARTTSALVELV